MGDFIEVNADLHLHGLYSGGVSSSMIPRTLAEQAPLKGIDVLGTSDILNARWIKLVKEQLKPAEGGLLEHDNGTKFMLQTEIEDSNRIHHILYFPGFSKVEEIREKFSSKCKNLDSDGRPKIWLSGEEITEICMEAGCMVGFAHAFTPYFGMFGKYDSYKDCYGSQWKNIHFMELGLSADTGMADRISELHDLTFLSNSDAHSPWPNKMGREFNRLKLRELSYGEIEMAIKRENGRKCALNVGFNPLEGKYHKTRCRGCLTFFEPSQASSFSWKCPSCGNSIKKGVDFRIEELSDTEPGKHPEHRPPYRHIIPLSEIISLAIGIKSAYSQKVQDKWKEFMDAHGSEAKVLLETGIPELSETDAKIAEYIDHFRKDKISYMPGGAGVYGKLLQPGKTANIKKYSGEQKSLSQF